MSDSIPQMNDTPCIIPWTDLHIMGGDKGVKHCCWQDFSLDPDNYDSLTEMWNSPQSQALRETMLSGEYPNSCPESCPVRSNGGRDSRWFDEILSKDGFGGSEAENLQQLASEIERGRTELDARPYYLSHYSPFECNVDCVMCWEQYHEKSGVGLPVEEYPDYDAFYNTAGLLDFRGGEPLLGKSWRKITETLESHPAKRVLLFTNGLLINNVDLEQYLDRFEWISVSLNGATKEVHEQINQGSEWETVMQNLQYLLEKRALLDSNKPRISIGMVILPQNYHQIPEFAELASNFGIEAYFQLGRAEGHEKNQGGPSEITYDTLESLSSSELDSLSKLIESTRSSFDSRYTGGLGSTLTAIDNFRDA